MIFTHVTVNIHGVETPFELHDHVEGNVFNNYAVQAVAALTRHEAIHMFIDEVELFIPYHAVMSWTKTITNEEITKPEDDFCQPIECLTAPMCDGGSTGDVTLYSGNATFNDKGIARVTPQNALPKTKNGYPAVIDVSVDGTPTGYLLSSYDGVVIYKSFPDGSKSIIFDLDTNEIGMKIGISQETHNVTINTMYSTPDSASSVFSIWMKDSMTQEYVGMETKGSIPKYQGDPIEKLGGWTTVYGGLTTEKLEPITKNTVYYAVTGGQK